MMQEKLKIVRKNRETLFIILIAMIAMSFIALYAGHFLLSRPGYAPDSGNREGQMPEKERTGLKAFPVRHRHIIEEIKGQRQEINILEIDLADGRAEVFPILSHDKVFGFEKLSAMVSRKRAYAAVNGGFFHKYGEPSGMVVIDGEIITKSTGRYPVFIADGGKAYLKEISMNLRLEGTATIGVDAINVPGNPGQAVVYTPAYGDTNRVEGETLTAVIEDGTVSVIGLYSQEVKIPDGGMLLTFLPPFTYPPANLPLKVGDRVKISSDLNLSGSAQAYECGSWIVRNGETVIGKQDEWVGVMTNWDPRTAIGRKDEDTVVLFTVDGRQPGYSAGLTGAELADVLLKYGVKDAAMLDGGASTEMIIEGKIANRPSFKGQERPLGGAIAVRLKEWPD